MGFTPTLSVNERCTKYLLLALALTRCVSVYAAKSRWDSILSTVNQEPAATSATTPPYTHALNDDLLAVYAAEINAMSLVWKAMGNKDRNATNRFYFEKMAALNEATLAKVSAASADSAGKNHRAVAERILKQVHDNPVAKVENVMHYDPSGQIGFCFGRAFYIHYQLLKAGVKLDDIARIFVVGELLLEKQLWNFHTAILVRDAEDGFLVIDPLQPKLMGYREWMKVNAAYEIKGRYSRARFYVTDPRKFLPAYSKYDRKQLEHPALKEYFDALALQMK